VIELDELTTQIAHHSSKSYSTNDIGYDDTVEIVFTSRATAEPGVRITHRNLMVFDADRAPVKRYLKWGASFTPFSQSIAAEPYL